MSSYCILASCWLLGILLLSPFPVHPQSAFARRTDSDIFPANIVSALPVILEETFDGENVVTFPAELDGSVNYFYGESQAQENLPACSTYLGISLLPNAGRGIFAGHDFDQNDILDPSVAILIPNDVNYYSPQIHNYAVPSIQHPQYSILYLGIASMMNGVNHHHLATVQDMLAPYEEMKSVNISTSQHENIPYANHTDLVFYTLRSHAAGEEMLRFYGTAWYQQRRLSPEPYKPLPTVEKQQDYFFYDEEHGDEDDCDENGCHDPRFKTFKKVCLSDVHLRTSSIDEAGRGLFASRSFKKGELVTISPVAVLEKSFVDSLADRTVLQNYCLWDGKSSIVLLPLLNGIMMNHQPSEEANIEIKWFSWQHDETDVDVKKYIFKHATSSDLLSQPVAPLDIGFHATKDIAEGEELFLNYGDQWVENWLNAKCHSDDHSHCDTIGNFRSYIYVNQGLFPFH